MTANKEYNAQIFEILYEAADYTRMDDLHYIASIYNDKGNNISKENLTDALAYYAQSLGKNEGLAVLQALKDRAEDVMKRSNG